MRVAIVGCGAMGAAAAWRLSARGAEVVGFDLHSPPHNLGSSHGETRITRTAYFEGEWYVPLLQATFPMWRALEQKSRTRLLINTELVTLGAPESEAVGGVLKSARLHALDCRLIDAAEYAKRYPALAIEPHEVAAVDYQAGILFPEAAVGAMLAGVDVRRGARVTAVEPVGAGVVVVHDGQRESFDAAVVATGAWMRELAPFVPVTVERQVSAWLELEAGAAADFAVGRFPLFYRTGEFGDVYGFPSLDGRTMKLARHHGGEPANPDLLRRQVDASDFIERQRFAARWLRGVSGRVDRFSVCMYTNTPDGHFVIDTSPASARIVIVSACSGHGFKFAPVIGDVAADLVLLGETRRPISSFALARFKAGQVS